MEIRAEDSNFDPTVGGAGSGDETVNFGEREGLVLVLRVLVLV